MELLQLVSRRWRARWGNLSRRRQAVVPVLQADRPEPDRGTPAAPAAAGLCPRWLGRARSSSSSASWKPSLGSISEDGSFPCADAAGNHVAASRRGRSTAAAAAAAARATRGDGAGDKGRSPPSCTRGAGPSASSTRSNSYRRDFSASSMPVVTPALVPAPFLF